MKKLLAAVTVLAVSTAQADTIYVDASCPGGDGSELDSSTFGLQIRAVMTPPSIVTSTYSPGD